MKQNNIKQNVDGAQMQKNIKTHLQCHMLRTSVPMCFLYVLLEPSRLLRIVCSPMASPGLRLASGTKQKAPECCTFDARAVALGVRQTLARVLHEGVLQ